jgi:hypothetical protein
MQIGVQSVTIVSSSYKPKRGLVSIRELQTQTKKSEEKRVANISN